MSAPAETATRVPFQVADSFVLALDDFMARTAQGGHVSQSILELEKIPDLALLRVAADRLIAKHPLLVATPKRCWRTLLPYWSVPTAPQGSFPLGIWREELASTAPFDASVVSNARDFLQGVMMESLPKSGDLRCNARLDVVAREDGRCLVALSWSHLLLDGKGAALLLEEIARLCDGVDMPVNDPTPARPAVGLLAKLRKAKPALDHLTGLQKTGTPSLGGPTPRQGGGFYEVLTLPKEQFMIVLARIEAAGSTLFPFTFYVACVARAHDRVFRSRGREPEGYGISVPIQTRQRGAKGPLFHNHVAVREHHTLWSVCRARCILDERKLF